MILPFPFGLLVSGHKYRQILDNICRLLLDLMQQQ